MSVSIWALVIVALVRIEKSDNAQMPVYQWIMQYLQVWKWQMIPPQYASPLGSYSSLFFRNPAYVAVTLSFFIVVVSGLWSEDVGYWLTRVRIKIPLLVLPIAFCMIPPLSARQFWRVWYFFFMVFTLFSIYHLCYYFTHFDASNKGLGQGIPIKSFKSHIVFTTMAAFAVMVGIELWQQKITLKYKWESRMVLISTILLIVALHIFSVRTGLLTLYVCLFVKIIMYIFKQRKIIMGLIALSLMALIPIIAYTYIPSFTQRVNYTIWDFQQYNAGNKADKSDSGRLVSLKVGLEIARENPILGVGFGDVIREVSKKYEKEYPSMLPREPHSFLLFTVVGAGLVGLIIWFAAVLIPIFYKQAYRNALFLFFNIIFIFNNIIDYIVEGTHWSIFYAFAVSLFIHFIHQKET